jgi:pyrroloquinoline quinone biosynthesis protein B
VRLGSPALRSRTEESVAISSDEKSWFVVNVGPEVRRQLETFPALHPKKARGCPVSGFFLTNGDLDHTLGLLALRESERLTLYATERVRRGFVEGNPLYRTLERFPGQITWKALAVGERLALPAKDGTPSGLSVEPVPVPGKLPIHLDDGRKPDPSDNVGLVFRDEASEKTLAYLPAVARLSPEIEAAVDRADCVFFDGTFWSEDELVAPGLGDKRAADMAHWPLGGQTGSLGYLSKKSGKRRVFIHINNTNPVLRENSSQAKEAASAGIDVAWDGMEVEL